MVVFGLTERHRMLMLLKGATSSLTPAPIERADGRCCLAETADSISSSRSIAVLFRGRGHRPTPCPHGLSGDDALSLGLDFKDTVNGCLH